MVQPGMSRQEVIALLNGWNCTVFGKRELDRLRAVLKDYQPAVDLKDAEEALTCHLGTERIGLVIFSPEGLVTRRYALRT